MLITSLALLLLNYFSAKTTRELMFRAKYASAQDKIQVVASAFSGVDPLTPESAEQVISVLGNINAARLIVTNAEGTAVYDSSENQNAIGQRVLLPAVVEALRGSDVFHSAYQDDALVSSAAVPIMDHDSPNGCVYLMDYDAEQGNIIANLERTILQGSFVLLGAIILFSAFFATTSSRRMRKILTSMRMVREGDLNYALVVNQANSVSNGVKVDTNEILGQARISVIVFISMCCRAAIEGGLSPEEGYTLGDAYIQRATDAKDSTELGELSTTMYADFVHRVHRCRTNPEVSKQIQDCCAYIELHAEEEIPIDQLAKRFGYAEYYLTKKFKREMHTSLTNYIKYVRIERAKLLLTTTGLSLQEIADRLHFCSRSYFGKIFHEVVGCSPLEYRQKQ